MINIREDIPEEFNGYRFIRKYNENIYLYEHIKLGFKECFHPQDLGLVIKVKERCRE